MLKIQHQEIQNCGHQVARLLDDCGVPVRGLIAALLPNGAEFLYCLRGATWSGRTFIPVNWHTHMISPPPCFRSTKVK